MLCRLYSEKKSVTNICGNSKMDFNLKKFASDASSAFNRAKQFTEEKLGHAEKTELDAHFEV